MKFKNSLRGKILLVCGTLNLALLCAAIIYGAVTREAILEGREAVECFVKHNFLIYCPGCGGSRSLVYLLEFDFLKSFLYYPALPLSAAIIVYVDILTVIAFFKNSILPLKRIKPEILLLIPAVIFATFIIRNVLLIGFGIDTLGDITKIIKS